MTDAPPSEPTPAAAEPARSRRGRLERIQQLVAAEAVAFRDMAAAARSPRAADPDGVRLLSALTQLRLTSNARRGNHAPLERYFSQLGVALHASSMEGQAANDLCEPPVFAPPAP